MMSSTRGAAFWLLRLDRQWAQRLPFRAVAGFDGRYANVLRARLAIAENGGRIDFAGRVSPLLGCETGVLMSFGRDGERQQQPLLVRAAEEGSSRDLEMI